MMFLSPVPALIAAAIAVPALIALYLLKLRRKPLRVSSTLLWEQAAKDVQANVPLRWLRMNLPLLVQLLALLALLAALARPAIPSQVSTADRVIIAIDCSASMSASDGVNDGTAASLFVAARRPFIAPIDARPVWTRLDQARLLANKLIDELQRRPGPRVEAMVVAVSARTQSLSRFTTVPAQLREAVAAAEASDQPGDLAPLIQLAGAMTIGIDAANESVPNIELLIISDGGLDASKVEPALPAGITARLIPVGPASLSASLAQPDNLGIVAFSARRDPDQPELVRVFSLIQNASSQPIDAPLVLRFKDAPAGSRTITVPAATTRPDGSIQLGETSLSLELQEPRAGLLLAAITRPDRLQSDNQAGVWLKEPGQPRVLLVGPGRAGDPFAAARSEQGVDRFLLSVLKEMGLASLRVVDSASYNSAPESFSNFDLVIFDRVQPRLLPTLPTMSIGAGVPIRGVSVTPVAPGDLGFASSGVRFSVWKRSHPILRYAPLDAVLIAPPMRLTLPDPSAAAQSSAPSAAIGDEPAAVDVTVLAEGGVSGGGLGVAGVVGPGSVTQQPESTRVVIGPLIASLESPRGTRRLILAFDLLRTNWGPDVSFPVFISSSVEYLTGRGDFAGATTGSARSTLDPVAVRIAPNATQLQLTRPGQPPVVQSIALTPGSPTAELGIFSRAGVYTLTGTVPDDQILPINVMSSVATSLSSRAEIPLGRAGSGTRQSDLTAAIRPIDQSATATDPRRVQEIWHWFVLAAAGFLTLEWLILARQLRA